MFNLQGSEIIFILLIALVVLGPEKLPGAIRRVTSLYGELRKMSSGFQNEFKAVLDEPLREFKSTADLVKSAADPKRIAEEAEREAELEAAGAKKARQAREVTAAMEAAGAAHLAQAAATPAADSESAVDPGPDIDAFDDPVDDEVEAISDGDALTSEVAEPTVDDLVLDEHPPDGVTDDPADRVAHDQAGADTDTEFDAEPTDGLDHHTADDEVGARGLSSVDREFEPEGKSA